MRKTLLILLMLVLASGAYAFSSGATLSAPGPLVLLALIVTAAIFFPIRIWPSLRRFALPVLTAISFALAFWSAAPTFYTYPTVTLTVTGEKGKSAQGAEVWVVGMGLPSGPMSVEGFDGWAPRGTAVVGLEGTKKTILVPPKWPEGGVIRLGMGMYSGIVEVATDGHRSRIDLYSPTGNSIDVALPELVPASVSIPFNISTTALFAWSMLSLSLRASKNAVGIPYVVGFAAILAGVLVWIGTAKMSAPGPVELLIVSPNMATHSEPRRATAYLGTIREYAEAIPLPIEGYENPKAYHILQTANFASLTPSIAPLAILKRVGISKSREKALGCSRETP